MQLYIKKEKGDFSMKNFKRKRDEWFFSLGYGDQAYRDETDCDISYYIITLN